MTRVSELVERRLAGSREVLQRVSTEVREFVQRDQPVWHAPEEAELEGGLRTRQLACGTGVRVSVGNVLALNGFRVHGMYWGPDDQDHDDNVFDLVIPDLFEGSLLPGRVGAA